MHTCETFATRLLTCSARVCHAESGHTRQPGPGTGQYAKCCTYYGRRSSRRILRSVHTVHLHSGLEMLKVTVLSLSLNVSYLIHAFRLVSIQPSPAKCCVHFSPQAGVLSPFGRPARFCLRDKPPVFLLKPSMHCNPFSPSIHRLTSRAAPPKPSPLCLDILRLLLAIPALL